jgi:glycosyltransferase involved in cell wall biosynthesis
MSDRYRVLIISSHPVQYASPIFRQMARHPQLEIQVAYCSLQGAEAAVDPEFGVEVKWDVPLLDGYPWVHVPNRSPWPRLGRFFGLVNPGLWGLIRSGQYDAVVSYTGYAYLSFWIAAVAAKRSGVPLLCSTDAYNLGGANPKRWKSWVKRQCLPFVYRVYDVVLAPSEATARFVASLGIPAERILPIPLVVDNEWWGREADRTDRRAVRARWGIPEHCGVLLFSAKLQPRKRPQDVLRAFAMMDRPDCFLIVAGDGPLRKDLEQEAKTLGVSQRVITLGFVNQAQLPELYRAADLYVLPSQWDGCPLAVCEAMACGCPVVLSDAIPGRFELVRHRTTGFIYRCGDVGGLAAILREALGDLELLKGVSASARERVKTWSPRENIEAVLRAVDQAMAL